jgi:hypothetical protein
MAHLSGARQGEYQRPPAQKAHTGGHLGFRCFSTYFDTHRCLFTHRLKQTTLSGYNSLRDSGT